MQDGGEEGRRAAVEDTTEPQIDVMMDVAVLLCRACLLPLKPPIFKCEAAGHALCSYCRGGHGDICSHSDTHCGELDAVVGAAKVPCPYREFGCERYVVFHGAAEHKRACPCAPCSCPDPGCPFVGAPPALLDHLAAGHARPVIAVRYGRSWNIRLSLSQVWHVLVGQEDRSVFLVSLGALSAAATAVSVVHVRADGAAGPRFWCKLSVELPGKDKNKRVLMSSTVSSSALTGGAPAPGQGMFLAVPQELLPGDMLAVRVRIDQLRPTVAAAVKSTSPQARTSKRTMLGASAKWSNGGSPSAMDEISAKKPRMELSNGHVKEEVVAVRLDMRVLHCPLCARPFKPPVLQCNDGHLACDGCVAALPDGLCESCEDGEGIFGPCHALDAVVSSARVACPHDGCARFVVYHEAGEHQNACRHAPCHCTEPGCGCFAGSAAALAGHLAAVHAVQVRKVKYGEVSQLQLPASVPRFLLVGENDGRVFLLTMGALGGAGAAAVSVVCVRASASARPRFKCKMWVNLTNGNGGKSDVVLVEMQVRSSTSPGAVVAADEPTFLTVPPAYRSAEVALSVRIDKVSPWSS